MKKMTAERAMKILAETGTHISVEQAALVVDFLRKLAKIAVTQYLREKEELLLEREGDITAKTA